MRPLLLALLLLAPPVLANPADPPQLAPRFVEQSLPQIGYVTPRRPAPGGGDGIGGCSATLVAPTIVLTAAHCIANRVNRPAEVHVTFGWRDGPPLWRGTAARITLAQAHQPGRVTMASAGGDIALVLLPRPVPADLLTPLPLAPPSEAESYALWGFRNGSPTILTGHPACRLGTVDADLFVSNCAVVSGFSGAPLLADTPDGPAVAGVAVAMLLGEPRDDARSVIARIPPEIIALIEAANTPR